MTQSKRVMRSSPRQARSFWTEELTDAAKAVEATRIACSPEDHGALRHEAARVAQAERRDMIFDATTPRLVSVTFTRRAASS